MTLSQLACRKLTFEGESMAQLMFKIANEADTDVRPHGPSVPARCPAIPDAPAGSV